MLRMTKNRWQLMVLLLIPVFSLAAVALELEDPLQPLQPKKPRSESDQDKIISSAYYAHGRMLMQRENFSGALRRFQRAWRYHPESVSILSQIVPLAFELKHDEEGFRYAVLLAEKDSRNPRMLQRLAMELTKQRDWEKALEFYEKSIKLLGEAIAKGFKDWELLKTDQTFDPLRGDAEFKKLLKDK